MTDPRIPDDTGARNAPEDAGDLRAFYDAQAAGYAGDDDGTAYREARRCADALARFATDPTAPLAEFGCGSGLGGLALRAAGFDSIDGFDRSEAMLERAAEKGVYRELGLLDLSQPLEVEAGRYANAAAIGVVDPTWMPATVVDAMLALLPAGGCLALSIDARAASDGRIRGRICELTDTGAADLLLSEATATAADEPAGPTVYVLRRR